MEERKPKKIRKMFDIIPPESKEEEDYFTPEKLEEEIEEIPAVEPTEEAPEEFEDLGEEERVFPKDIFTPKSPINKKKIFIIGGIICLLIIGFVVYFSLSRAEVVLHPKTETMEFQTTLNIDKNIAFIDLDNNKIPGQVFQVEKEKEKELPATQEKELREKARGTITVYNQYSSASQTLVKATRFVSEQGKLFRTTETITVPGAKIEEGEIIPSSVDVEVVAAEPGEEYNIGPTSFTIPGFKGTAKYTGFYGRSNKPMTGGAVGRVKIVSAEDIQGAKDILIAELEEEAKNELEKRVPSELKILKETTAVEVVESSSNVEAEQPAEKFTVKVKVAAKVLGFSENDAISLVNDNLKSKISEDKTLIPDTIKINYNLADINLEKGIATLNCEIKEDVAWKISVDETRHELAGKKETEVRQYLASQPEIESAKVIFWPFWVKKIPSNEEKIKVIVEWE